MLLLTKLVVARVSPTLLLTISCSAILVADTRATSRHFTRAANSLFSSSVYFKVCPYALLKDHMLVSTLSEDDYVLTQVQFKELSKYWS